jgi:uncharacterized membrane protein
MATADKSTALTLPWRYGLFLLLCLSAFPAIYWQPWYKALLIGFDIAALGYFATMPPLFNLNEAGMLDEAQRNDPKSLWLIIVTGIVMVVILAAVATELLHRDDRTLVSIALCISTLAIAWCFSHLVYALHYAHLFYDPPKEVIAKGLSFPKTKAPLYWDFVYFSFTLGMTFQTSDVTIENTYLRKIVTIQSLAAFVYNLGILAFSINILAS